MAVSMGEAWAARNARAPPVPPRDQADGPAARPYTVIAHARGEAVLDGERRPAGGGGLGRLAELHEALARCDETPSGGWGRVPFSIRRNGERSRRGDRR
ncbi:hypothetical protein ACWDBD_36455 [Streptomyces sp. NPDC001118]